MTTPPPFQHVIYNGKLMDEKTKAFVQAMEAELGYALTIVQGCYNVGGVAASAGTHDGGGVIDLAPFDWERKVRVARKLGGFAWHRPFNWDGRNGGEHIHVGMRNHGNLSGAAQSQQVQYDAHPPTNGLANHAADPTWHPSPPVSFHYPPKAPPTPTFRAVSINDDWANIASDVAGLVNDIRPLVMGVQEGWRVDYHKVIPDRWRCRQVLENKATAGVAVIWDRRKLAWVGTSTNPRKRGRGIQVVGKGVDTRDRPVVWRDLAFRPGINHGNLPPVFRLASVHRLPMRDRADWGTFDANLELWLKVSPIPVLLFMDSNEHGGPAALTKKVGGHYSWHGVPNSIDGTLSALPVKQVEELPKRSSDHHPVVVTLG